MLKIALALGTALYACLSGPASACQGKNFILDETFKTRDVGWDAPEPKVSYGPAGASIIPDPNNSYFSLNSNFTSDGVDICTTFAWPNDLNRVKDKNAIYGGIVLWAKDYSNYYVVAVKADGNVNVSRLIAKKWSVVALKKGDDLKLARLSASDRNEIEVQITGSHATVRLNDKPVLEFNGQPPSGGGYVGIFAGAGEPASPIVFSRFQLASMP